MLSSTVKVSVLTVVCVPLIVKLPVTIKSLAKVLSPPILCVPVVLTTVLSTETAPELMSIPVLPLKCALVSAALGPVYVNTPEVLL